MIKIYDLNEVPEEEIFCPSGGGGGRVRPGGGHPPRRGRSGGDAALLEYEKQFDRVELSALEVTPQELEEGAAQVDGEFHPDSPGGRRKHPRLPRQAEAGGISHDPAGGGGPGSEDHPSGPGGHLCAWGHRRLPLHRADERHPPPTSPG